MRESDLPPGCSVSDIPGNGPDDFDAEDCPFCGMDCPDHHDDGNDMHWIECRGCEAMGPAKDTLDIALAAWNLRASLSAALSREKAANEALVKADEAIGAWLHQYAGEFCDEKRVKEHAARIKAAGGTLAYISDVHGQVRAALSPIQPPTPEEKK